MTLHDPFSVATPSQRLAAAAHNARIQRINCAAVIRKVVEATKVDDAQVEILEDRWVVAQKLGWFEIIAEKAAPGRAPKIDDIIKVCCKYFDLTRSQLISDRRTAPVVYARQIAMYLSKFHTTKSYPEIGRRLGGRDHTTVLHGHRKIESSLRKNAILAYDVAHVEAML
jgi:hypothetical protein